LLKVIRRLFSFGSWSATHPGEPPPGDWLDAQFDEIVDKVDEWDARVRSAITPDGRVAPGTVYKESLYPAFFADLTAQVLKIAENTLQQAEELAARAEMAANRADYLKNQAEAAAYRAKHAESELATLKIAISEQNGQISALTAPIPAPNVVNDDPTESFAGHSEAWARTSMLWAEHMPDILPDDALVGLDITGDHWSSRWWANRADNAFGRLTDLYLGAHPIPPATNLEGGPIQPGSIYFDTDPPPGQMYVWNGSQWVSMTQPARAGLATLWYAATDGQTVFPFAAMDLNGHNYTLAIDATEGVDAHVNGVKVMPREVTEGDWTLDPATSTVTFLRPLRLGDVVSFDIMMANEKLGPGAVNAWSLGLTEAKDGVRQTFTLDMEDGAGPAVTVNKNEELVVSLDGVIQEPGISYSASGSTIDFMQAPAADSWVFITWFRSEGGAGTLSTGGGNTFRIGTGAPATGLGAVGDVYLDTATGKLYGPKADAGVPVPADIVFRAVSSIAYGSRASTTINKPTGVIDGDIMLAVVFGGHGTPSVISIGAPAGWTQIGANTSVTAGGFTGKLYLYWKRAASEGASYTFTQTNTHSTQAAILAYSGCLETGDPVDVFSTNTGLGSTLTALGVTTTVAAAQLVFAGNDWTGGAVKSPPSGMTERFDDLVYVAGQLLVAAGATGNRTMTSPNLVGDAWGACLVALKPGSAGPVVWPQSADLATQAELDAAT
jgi:hypothetical protein